MKKYIETKHVEAEPMTLVEANKKGLLQAEQIPNEVLKVNNHPGYRVRYEDGHELWYPAKVFEKKYKIADSFLDRLIIERDELDDKVVKLKKFLENEVFASLSITQQNLLNEQYEIMCAYLTILNDRITLCKN